MANPFDAIAKHDKETQTKPLEFPMDGSTNSQHTIINLIKYIRGNPSKKPSHIPAYIIKLPLPMSGISDNVALQYSDDKLGGFIGGLLEPNKKASGMLGYGIASAVNLPSTLGDALSDLVTKYAGAGAGKAISGLVDPATSALKQAVGLAINPNLSLTFSGVQLRTHRFTWRLIAKSQQESAAIESIIKALKISALPPKLDGANFVLGYPHTAVLEFLPTGLILSNKMGCFITDINVQYDGDGYPAFFKGNKPVIVDLSIGFRERAILTSEDYGGASDTITVEAVESAKEVLDNLINKAIEAIK